MLQLLVAFFKSYGYAAVFGVLILCGIGLPVPEDISLAAGGVISGLGYTNPYVMFTVSFIGVLIGDTTMFLIGKHFGLRFMDKRIVGKIINHARNKAIVQWFHRYGKWMLLAARFMPGFRPAIFLTAGITRFVRYPVFILIDGLAALVSVPLWIYAGYYGASHWEWLKTMIARSHIAVLIILAFVVMIIALLALYRYKMRKIEKAYSEGSSDTTV